jgi:hypothetical protein
MKFGMEMSQTYLHNTYEIPFVNEHKTEIIFGTLA